MYFLIRFEPASVAHPSGAPGRNRDCDLGTMVLGWSTRHAEKASMDWNIVAPHRSRDSYRCSLRVHC